MSGGRGWTVADEHGHARWPAPEFELAFNAIFFVWAIVATRHRWQREQRFHVYLVAYGVFRFSHEFMRNDPRWISAFGGYHVIAAGLVTLGVWGCVRRRRAVSYFRSSTDALRRDPLNHPQISQIQSERHCWARSSITLP